MKIRSHFVFNKESLALWPINLVIGHTLFSPHTSSQPPCYFSLVVIEAFYVHLASTDISILQRTVKGHLQGLEFLIIFYPPNLCFSSSLTISTTAQLLALRSEHSGHSRILLNWLSPFPYCLTVPL